MRVSTVTIVQPYVPEYRISFFDQVQDLLSHYGHSMRLVTGRPDRAQAKRKDEAPMQPDQTKLRTYALRTGRWGVSWKNSLRFARRSDLVIAQQGAGVLDTSALLIAARGRVALWGHGPASTGNAGAVDAAIERWQLRASKHFFAYTPRGGDFAFGLGIPRRSITVLNNSVDTSELRALMREQNSPNNLGPIRQLGIGNAPVAAYLGGLDEPKRIGFLLDAANLVGDSEPDFRLLIAGDGAQRKLVERAARRNERILYIGRANSETKVALARHASILLNPGRVGLVAVESFTLGLPIVTTQWPHHAPEFDYLIHDTNAWVSRNTKEDFARDVLSLLRNRDQLTRLRQGCYESAQKYGTEQMARLFVDGVLIALSERSCSTRNRGQRKSTAR